MDPPLHKHRQQGKVGKNRRRVLMEQQKPENAEGFSMTPAPGIYPKQAPPWSIFFHQA
jgi:hypothetical protein